MDEIRRLTVQQYYDDLTGNRRLTPAGSLVLVESLYVPCSFMVSCPTTGWWLFSQKEIDSDTEPVATPEDCFESEEAFFINLKRDRPATLYKLFERKVEEGIEDGDWAIIGRLTQWAIDGLNLGDDDVIMGLAESLIDGCSEEVKPGTQ